MNLRIFLGVALLAVLLLLACGAPAPPVLFGVAFAGFWNWVRRTTKPC